MRFTGSAFLLVLAWLPLAVRAADSYDVLNRHRAGDDPRWAEPGWNDSDWAAGRRVPARTGIHWVRVHIPLTAERRIDLPWALPTAQPVDVLWLAAPYSYEVFWDGRLIGRSGVVGRTREEEQTGRLEDVFPIPPELLGPGPHVVAMRISSFHYNFPATEFEGAGFFLTGFDELYRREIQRVAYPLVGTGGALLVALISLVLFWLADRWRPLLLLSGASFALALFYFLVAWRWLHNDPYEWFYPRLVAATGAMTLVAFLFPWLLLEQFGVPRRGWWLAGLVPLVVLAWTVPPAYEFKSLGLCYAMLALCVAIAGWAAKRQRIGAGPVLATVLIGLLIVRADRREFLHPSFFATFGMLGLVVFATLGAQVRAHRRQAQAATLAAARLETELLKKHIQPHFLLNTLATIMEVIEQNPKTAVAMIEALAGEFRILARVAGGQLIPLAQELELCRAHLRIMSLRKATQCSLAVDGDVDARALVPPALFHTLIENGLTHLTARDGAQRFRLSGARHADRVRYTLVAEGEPIERAPVAATPRREGTGLRYIKARLEESFPGRWSFDGGPVPEGWKTEIEFPRVEEPAAPQTPVPDGITAVASGGRA